MLNYLIYYNKFKKLYNQNPQEIEPYQNKLLQQLIQKSYRDVPFYQKLYQQFEIDPNSIRDRQDLLKLPIVSKTDFIKSANLEYLSSKFSITSLLKVNSAGSTGHPFNSYFPPHERNLRNWQTLYMYKQYGMHFWDNKRYFTLYKVNDLSHFLQKYGFWRSRSIPCSFQFDQILDTLIREKVNIIDGMPSFLSLLALENTKRTRKHKLKLAIAGGEHLSEKNRKLIMESFECDCRTNYGSTEAGRIGFECQAHTGYHLNPEYIIEIIKDDQPVPENTPGDIVITALRQEAMPLLRYNIKDIGQIDYSPCPCGHKAPRLKNIQGRSGTFFIDKNGQKVSITNMYFSWQMIGTIYQYKLLQKKIGQVEIEIVLNPAVDKKQFEKEFQTLLDSIYQNRFSYSYKFLSHIDAPPQGKYFAMNSSVDPN
jgi:phenylacetate-CoA ligase